MNELKTKKFNRLPKLTSLRIEWNMSIADYNNDRISEDELRLKLQQLIKRVNNNREEIYNDKNTKDSDWDWREIDNVIDLKQYKQSFDNKLKMVA